MIRYCNKCGEQIKVKPSHYLRGNGRFCSRGCASRAYWEAKSSYNRMKKVFRCHNCGREIIIGRDKFKETSEPRTRERRRKTIRWHTKCPEGALDSLRHCKINRRRVRAKV